MSERCGWCGTEPIYMEYHDTEWGRPETGSRALYEKLMLDGFQAGLSWLTILKKRESFRARFQGFDPARVARWGEAEIAAALADPGIVRHRGKIEAAIGNARAWLEIEARGGFDRFLWQFVDFRPVQNRWESMAQVPAETAMSKEMSKALKSAGFQFCGPTIVYAFAQAVGMVNDHLVGCPQHAECAAEAKTLRL
jgi:DNA-3-methyladenine glycosylase I